MSVAVTRLLYLPIGVHLPELIDPLHPCILVVARLDRHLGRGLIAIVLDAIKLDIHLAEIGARSQVLADRLADLNL